jgi:hypothetical protein
MILRNRVQGKTAKSFVSGFFAKSSQPSTPKTEEGGGGARPTLPPTPKGGAELVKVIRIVS